MSMDTTTTIITRMIIRIDTEFLTLTILMEDSRHG